MNLFRGEVKTHVSLLTQISDSIQNKLNQITLSTKRYKRGLLNGIGSIFKSITGNLDAEDGEYYSNCINKLSKDENELENLLKNQISVTTSVIKNFNATIQKLQIDEMTFNNNIKIIENAIYKSTDKIKVIEAKLTFLEKCEELMESYLYIEEYLNDILNSITFARLKIIHTSIIDPENLMTSLQEISQNLHQNNLPLLVKSSNIARYLDIIELEAFQTDSDLIFVLRIPLIDQQRYTLFKIYPIPILDNRTGLYHMLLTSQKYIARDDDSLMYIPISDLTNCKQLFIETKICPNMFAYPIDSNAMCEAQILKGTPRSLPENCQNSLIFAKGYKVQNLQKNTWLIINSEPLQITINCPEKGARSEMISRNSILQLQPECSAFIGVTKVQADSKEITEAYYEENPILIHYNCCDEIPDKIQIPKLKPLKLNNLNTEDLDIAKHKLEEYSKTLDQMIHEPFVTKHISWFTYFTITLIIILVILYIVCKCRRKRRLALAFSDNSPPHPPSDRKRFTLRLPRVLPRRRPSIRTEDPPEENSIELN